MYGVEMGCPRLLRLSAEAVPVPCALSIYRILPCCWLIKQASTAVNSLQGPGPGLNSVNLMKREYFTLVTSLYGIRQSSAGAHLMEATLYSKRRRKRIMHCDGLFIDHGTNNNDTVIICWSYALTMPISVCCIARSDNAY